MADPAARETDKIIAEIEERIAQEYAQAQREIQNKVKDYYRRFEIKDKTWERWVEEGKRTEAEYKEWRVGQLAIGERWEEMRDTIATDLLNTHKIALSVAQGYCPDVYALNHDYGTYQVERGSLTDTSYTLYSREAAERIFRENPQMLPGPGAKTAKDIAEKKILAWNNKHIQSVALQAILQGNSIPDIATRIANVAQTDRASATRSARTMMTNAQNMGRMDSYERAKAMGIPVRKQWLATLDMRTRHEHRLLDGVTVDTDKPFEVEGEKIRYPGDPQAPPHLTYNCRCTLIAAIKGYESDLSDTSTRHDKNLGGMSYDEWKESRKEIHRNILSQERTADAMHAHFVREYRERGGYVPSGRDMTLTIDALRGQERAKTFTSESLKGGMSHDGYMEFRKVVNGSETRPLYDKYIEQAKISQTDNGGMYYPSSKLVEWDVDYHDGRTTYSVLAHECGHFFDDMIGRSENLTYNEVDSVNDTCKIATGAIKAIKRITASCSDEFLGALRTDLDNLYDYLDSGMLEKDFLATDKKRNMTGGIQDALDGRYRTQATGRLPWGHGDAYYDQFYNDNIALWGNEDKLRSVYKQLGYGNLTKGDVKTMARIYDTAAEAFANVCGALTVGGDELFAWETLMPETTQAFRDILQGEASKNVDG